MLQAAIADANTNGGKLIINPVAGQEGYFTFTYTVTDQDGDIGTGTITIVILKSLAKDGLYDDASFNFIYNGTGWSPSFVTGAYNNTLHTTTTLNDPWKSPSPGLPSALAYAVRLQGQPSPTH